MVWLLEWTADNSRPRSCSNSRPMQRAHHVGECFCQVAECLADGTSHARSSVQLALDESALWSAKVWYNPIVESVIQLLQPALALHQRRGDNSERVGAHRILHCPGLSSCAVWNPTALCRLLATTQAF